MGKLINKIYKNNYPNSDKALIAKLLLTTAFLLQLIILSWVYLAKNVNFSFIVASITVVICFISYSSINHKDNTHTPSNALLFVLLVGGLGMLLGALIDSMVLAKELCITNDNLPIELTYTHHHGFKDIGSFMVLCMLALCLPSCFIFCSKHHRNAKQQYQDLCRHLFAAIVMMLSMLFLPELLLNIAKVVLSLNQPLIIPFVAHHILMLLAMISGTYLGYKTFGFVQLFPPKIIKQIERIYL